MDCIHTALNYFRIICLSLASSALCFTAAALETVTYQLDWLRGGDKAPIYVCIDQGFAAEEGIEIKIESGRGSTQAITKIATGVSDIGSAGLGALMAAKANETVPVKAVMSIFNTGPHAFYTFKDKDISQVTDLKGKRIASSPFTSSNAYLPLILAEWSMQESDVKLLKVDPSALGPMLATGRVDAIIAWMTDRSRYTNLLKSAGKEAVILPWSEAGLQLYSASLIASEKFLSERPEVAHAFIRAYCKALEFSRDHPEAASQSTANLVPELDIEDIRQSLGDALPLIFNPLTEKDGLGALDPDLLKVTWERVATAQELPVESLDLTTLVDPRFTPTN